MLLHSESAAEKHCTHKPLARDSIRSVKPCAYGERLSSPVSVRYVTNGIAVMPGSKRNHHRRRRHVESARSRLFIEARGCSESPAVRFTLAPADVSHKENKIMFILRVIKILSHPLLSFRTFLIFAQEVNQFKGRGTPVPFCIITIKHSRCFAFGSLPTINFQFCPSKGDVATYTLQS